MKKINLLFFYIFLSAAILTISAQAKAELQSNDDLMAWVSGRHLNLTWDPMPLASGYTIQAGFPTTNDPPCEDFEPVVSIDVGTSTTFSISNVADGRYCVQVSAYDADVQSIWDSEELELVVFGDAGLAGMGREYTGEWTVAIAEDSLLNSCQEFFELLGTTFPIQVEQRGRSLHVTLGSFNFRGSLSHDNTFMLAGAQPWRNRNCHSTFRYYMEGQFDDLDTLGETTVFFENTYFCRESDETSTNDRYLAQDGTSYERTRPNNPGRGRPSHASGGRPDHAGGGRPDHAGLGRPNNAGGGQAGPNNGYIDHPRVRRCTIEFTIEGSRVD